MSNQINLIPKTYSIGDMAEVYSEMRERAESIGYMVDMLWKEINKLPELTDREKIYFQSVTTCLNALEQLSYDNIDKFSSNEERLNEEWEINKKAVAL